MTENTRRTESGEHRGGIAVVLLAGLTLLLITGGLASAWFFKQIWTANTQCWSPGR